MGGERIEREGVSELEKWRENLEERDQKMKTTTQYYIYSIHKIVEGLYNIYRLQSNPKN